jgi:hypothetical protein
LSIDHCSQCPPLYISIEISSDLKLIYTKWVSIAMMSFIFFPWRNLPVETLEKEMEEICVLYGKWWAVRRHEKSADWPRSVPPDCWPGLDCGCWPGLDCGCWTV